MPCYRVGGTNQEWLLCWAASSGDIIRGVIGDEGAPLIVYVTIEKHLYVKLIGKEGIEWAQLFQGGVEGPCYHLFASPSSKAS